jgi:ABC-type phosphate/phosphonate transport system substrate-binding protein
MYKALANGLLAGLVFWSASALAAGGNALLGISEGVAEQTSFSEMQEKYQPLADYLGRLLKRKVTVESSQSFKTALTNLGKERYDLMFVRPSNIAGRAIRDNKYQLVATAKGDFAAHFIVRKNHGFKKPEDVLTHPIAMPEEAALMSLAGLATLRDLGGKKETLQLHYSRYQEAIPYMVEQKFADVGVVAPGQAKAWEKKGGVTLFKSRALPFWSIIASPKISANEVAAMQEALIAMDSTAEGKAILQKIGVKGWTAGEGKDYVEMMKWIGE